MTLGGRGRGWGQTRPSLRRWNCPDWTSLGKGRTWVVSVCLAWVLVILQTEQGMRVKKGR